jgi:hypothetical protein
VVAIFFLLCPDLGRHHDHHRDAALFYQTAHDNQSENQAYQPAYLHGR